MNEKGVFTFQEFSPHAIAGFSSRIFDADRDISLFLDSLGADPRRCASIKQVHGNRVLVAQDRARPTLADEGDALVTREKRLALVIRTADCAPVFLFDPEERAVGICHVGWRGARQGIVRQTVETMAGEFRSRPAALRAAMGPAIRESCYEVGPEFDDYFPGFVKQKRDKRFFDLVGFVKKELTNLGIPARRIYDPNHCTACARDQFFSARREGTETGRILSAILLR